MSQPIALDYEQSDSNWLPEFLRPPPPGPPISDPQQIRREYAYFRPRILFWSTVGYGTFYFVRKNLSVAMPVMMAQLHLQKTSLGLILTLHGVLYGTSKFLNGMLADRANARLFMALALIICAVMNVFFGLSVSMIFLGTFWMINGWFQGMGYPPCARLLTHWSAPRELASKMAVWNISHSLGGAAIVILCAKLLEHYHHWQICFFVPSAIALVMAGLLLLNLRDTPESVGLPPVESTPMPPIRGWGFCITCMIGVLVLCGGMYFMHRWDWQFCLVVLGISGAMALLILANLRDVPETTPGLHAADAQLQTQSAVPVHPIAADHFRQFLWDKVFSNKYIWLVSMANFTVYTIRFAIFDWGPTLLHEYKGMPLIDAASIVAGFEVAGLFGMLATGWLTDRLFAGRGAPICLVSMLLCGLSIFLFWKVAGRTIWLNTFLLAAAGFFVYGPQALVAVIVAHLATKRAAATAVGLTSIFGYASTVLSGWGLGALVQHKGWNPAFASLIGVAAVGAILFALALPAAAWEIREAESNGRG